MDSFTLNKIAGAVLGTCLVGMGIGLVAQGIYTPEIPKKPGYALPEPKPEAAAGGEKKPAEVPLPVLLAKADPKKGEKDAQVCGACHNFTEGAGAKVGPDLYNVVDREKGSAAGFDYSAGVKKKGGKWTYADLNEWLTNPAKYIPGTKMGYAGEASPEKRADIIVYLRSLSKNPVALPPVTEADKKAAEGGGEQASGGKPAAESFVQMVAAADPKKGEKDMQVCQACHNLKKGEGAKIGPDLYGVVDREKGAEQGFDYSAGLKKKGGKWTYADLNDWLTNPAKYIPGTKMGYAGEANEKKRAEIVAFLRSNADTPAPLPKAEEKKAEAPKGETKEASAEKPAEGGAAPAPGGGDFVKLVAAADPKTGKSDAQVCSACHNFKKGAGALVGPDLWGVVDREKGSVPGFDYSAGVKKKGGKWTYADLNDWLTNPAKYIPGTKMGYAGEPSEKKRAAIVAFLRTLADTPAPLPGTQPVEPAADKKAEAPAAKPDAKSPPPPPAQPDAKSPPPPAQPDAKSPPPPAKPDAANPPPPTSDTPKR